jgi:hypothetical protein
LVLGLSPRLIPNFGSLGGGDAWQHGGGTTWNTGSYDPPQKLILLAYRQSGTLGG